MIEILYLVAECKAMVPQLAVPRVSKESVFLKAQGTEGVIHTWFKHVLVTKVWY
jgi:hypothetical protein